jgi:hypothetical protein
MAAPGVHPAMARRIATNIAKMPELLQKIAKISGEHIA